MATSYTTRERALIAAALGHESPTVEQSRRGWHFNCACGYRSIRQGTQREAVLAGIDHFLDATTAAIAAGSNRPAAEIAQAALRRRQERSATRAGMLRTESPQLASLTS